MRKKELFGLYISNQLQLSAARCQFSVCWIILTQDIVIARHVCAKTNWSDQLKENLHLNLASQGAASYVITVYNHLL